MTAMRIVPIVEGHGEREAVPILVRRIALEVHPGLVPEVLHPIRIPASRLVKQGEIERAVELASLQIGEAGGILVILDCDDGCPAQDGPSLLERARLSRPDKRVSVILAKKEYEAWFIAAAESLRGKHGLPRDLECPPDPEAIRPAKQWLSEHMPPCQPYSETTHQAALTSEFDMAEARRRSDSFHKCYREIFSMVLDLRAREMRRA